MQLLAAHTAFLARCWCESYGFLDLLELLLELELEEIELESELAHGLDAAAAGLDASLGLDAAASLSLTLCLRAPGLNHHSTITGDCNAAAAAHRH